MRDVFSKRNLPLIEKVVHNGGTPRDYWTLAATSYDRDGMTYQKAIAEKSLLVGAHEGDPWSMCLLARSYYRTVYELCVGTERERRISSQMFLHAASWWVRAARMNDYGATEDIKKLDVMWFINNYTGSDSFYTNIEIKCALLTIYILEDFGLTKWGGLAEAEKISRCERLLEKSCELFGISTPRLEFPENPKAQDGREVGGLADPAGVLTIRHEYLDWLEQLIKVLFHELGHFVLFEMMGESDNAVRLRERLEITPERRSSWFSPERIDGLPQSERDPDTLSYGVFTAWAMLFAKDGQDY